MTRRVLNFGVRVAAPRVAVALAGLGSVASLLAWVFGLGAFRDWFLLTGLPAIALLGAAAVVLARRPDLDIHLRLAVVSGGIGGLLGTLGYDLFRIPFVVGGLRLFAPIDSYGVLLLGTDASSSWTGFAGWSYHFANGIGFGIAYAVVALGRRWPWAVLWGMALETATILTPFADTYAIRGKWDLISIAYAAHLAYGIPLGLVVQRAKDADPRRPLPVPAWVCVGALVVGLLLWLRPGSSDPVDRAGRSAAPGPSVVVADGRFRPEWSRVAPGECVLVRNVDDVSYTLPGGAPLTAGGGEGELCVHGIGAHRVKLLDTPYSGGFVLVDDQRAAASRNTSP